MNDNKKKKKKIGGQNLKHIPLNSLEEYGYKFHNGKLLSIETNELFKFDAYEDKDENQKRYESIGKLIDEAIYEKLESECHLNRVSVPIDAKKGEPTSFIFTSNNLSTADFLMIIIHGTGVVRAGQWSRKLIMNEGIEIGSQFEYIRRAQLAGYGVIVTNTNLNACPSVRALRSNSNRRSIRGSETAEKHGCYVWEHFVRQNPAKHICIMAHSYGGAVVIEMANQYFQDFQKRVFAIALTDSPVSVYGRRVKKTVLKMLKKKTINWVVDTDQVDTDIGEDDCCYLRSAGHTVHEWTSHTSINAIFKYFSAKRNEIES